MSPYGGNPSGSNNDALKLTVGDTSTSSATELLSTGECAYLITAYGSVSAAAPYAAEAIAAYYAQQVDRSVGDLRLAAQQRFEHYMALAKRLRASRALNAAVPYAGGISVSDKDSYNTDTDLVAPSFTVGQHDYPGTSQRSTST